MWRGGLTDASASYVVPFERLNDHYKEEFHSEANAAIAAMVDALLSDEAVEAGADAMCGPERKGEWGYEIIRTAHSAQYVRSTKAVLRRIGAVEGETT